MGYITLLSDFGLQDASVASAKGILHQAVPGSEIVDISHLVEPFHLQQAAYLLSATYRNFPAGTCHVLLCDVFSETEPRLILGEKDGQYFLAPDNGILSLAFGNSVENVWQCFELQAQGALSDWIRETGAIVHKLQTSKAADLQLQQSEFKNASQHWKPRIDGNTVECQVIHIDRFGNVVINITREQFIKIGRNRPFRISMVRDEVITEISRHYYDVKPGDKLCRFNSAEYLEISINRGNAATLLGLRLHKEQHIMYNNIKIFFE